MRDVRALGRLVSLLFHERPDIVVGSTPKAAMLSLVAARVARVPNRIFLVRGARWDRMSGNKGRLLKFMDQVPAASATHIVSVSASLAALLRDSGITSKPVIVLGRGGSKGVDLERFRPAARAVNRPPSITFVGRLAQDKGIDDVLRVFDICRSVVPDLQLNVAGSVDPAQPILDSTRAALKQSGVNWLGHVRRVPELMQRTDVLVFPSVREGLPNVVLEAAASGVPTVGYQATGVVDAVEDGVTGRLVPVGDVEALGTATLELLQSPDLRRMGSQARTFAETWFGEEKVVSGYVEFMESQVREAGSASRR
jgi:glycosyltransferase involved in cell wall biosynthesis